MYIDVLIEMCVEVWILVINVLLEIEFKLMLVKFDNLLLIEWEDLLFDDIISEVLSFINCDEFELYD